MKFRLSRRWLLRICPVVALLIVAAYASVHRTSQLLAGDVTISESVHVRYAARDLLFSMIDLETGMRGFVILGDEHYLGPFNSGVATAERHVEAMCGLLGNDPRQQQRLVDLQFLVGQEVAESQWLVALRRTAGAQAASLALTTGDARPTMDRIRQVIAEILDTQDKLLEQQGLQGESATRQARNTLRTIVFGNTAAAVLVLAACYFLYRGESRRHRAEAGLIQSLDGFSQTLLEDYGDKLDTAGQESLRRIRAASQRIGQLIDDLLNLSGVDHAELTRERVDLSRLAREIADEVCASEPGRAAEFVIAGNLVAETDARLLRIVLVNLVNNAWKFSAGRTLARIEFGCDGPDSYFVRDNGAGFDMRYADKLFGAFQHLHAATEFPGTGIGLATVQRIINRHGGRVWAEGKPDGGATFHFTLRPPVLSRAA